MLIVLAGLWFVNRGNETFTAQGFVDAANAEGAAVGLGEPLPVDTEDKEILTLRLTGTPTPGTDAQTGTTEAGAGVGEDGTAESGRDDPGTLTILAGEDNAITELRRCRDTATLICFRANNVVASFSPDADPLRLQRFAAALARMGGGNVPRPTP